LPISWRVRFLNLELLDPYMEKQQSIVVMISHQFNWEWGLLIGSLQFPMAFDGVYKKLSNPTFNKLILDARSRFGAHMIEKESFQRELVKRRKIQRTIGLVADQLPRKHTDSDKYWTTFLNQETAFFVGGERVAKLLKIPVVFAKVYSTKRGYYDIELVELAKPPYEKEGHEILESYAKATEALIREEPEGWLWSHKRWKYKREEVELDRS